MDKKKNKRWRLFADPKVQGGLCIRVTIYWIVCQVVFAGTICGFDWLTQGSEKEGIHFLFQGFVVSSMFLPLVLFDLLTFSNRFAGPVWNFRNKMQKLADGEQVADVKFRPGDFYEDLMNNFNAANQGDFGNSQSANLDRATNNSTNEELLVESS